MMKFNWINKGMNKVLNKESAPAYRLTPEWELYTSVVTSRSLLNSPNSRKIRAAVMIPMIIPTRLFPVGTVATLFFMLPARTIPNVWRN